MGEKHYEMAYERYTPMRDARLWDGLQEIYLYLGDIFNQSVQITFTI
jgi:hypothetical protein